MQLKLYLSFFLISVFSSQSVIAQDNKTFDEFMKLKNQQFNSFIEDKQREFDEFRRKINEDFAKLMEQGRWEVCQKHQALQQPVEKDLRPVIYDEKKDGSRKNKQHSFEAIVYEKSQNENQPKPIVPIKQNEISQNYNGFMFYGTKMKARWGDLSSFKLNGIDENSLANGFRYLTNEKYNNLLNDCLSLRDNYVLCDWAYYKLLEAISSAICGKGSNEATFLQGVLYQQSGYTMRFAVDQTQNSLYLLVKVNGVVYDVNTISVDNKTFYLFNKSKSQQLKVCNIAYTDEQDMSMSIKMLPRFEFDLSEMKEIKSQSYHMNVRSAVNKNLIDFMREYPTSYDGEDVLTKWAYYANTPVSEEIKQLVYPQLKDLLKITDKVLAVNMLLNWVQTGFVYELDDKVWGRDRAFFAEETLFYPFSDCEDRAILFSHLVRDLLGLDVVLVYYPGHMATAVCFDGEVSGDFLVINNKKYTIADPCYTRARVGRTMPELDNKMAKVILCKR